MLLGARVDLLGGDAGRREEGHADERGGLAESGRLLRSGESDGGGDLDRLRRGALLEGADRGLRLRDDLGGRGGARREAGGEERVANLTITTERDEDEEAAHEDDPLSPGLALLRVEGDETVHKRPVLSPDLHLEGVGGLHR